MNKLLIVLGAPNDDLGNLSQIAKDRLACAHKFYNANNDFKLVCTGGFGQHFNTTDKPHHYYAEKYLLDSGIPADAFLNGRPSSNTMEDFQMTKDLVLEEKPGILAIITSDFHVSRARVLYRKIINYPQVVFIPASSSLSQEQLLPLVEHESQALKKLFETDSI
ncbi:MAG: YdcF family protein [Chitinophaga sp.]|uniref:YdcF family protein n=1 Tax=Chitinophaga sp. TaxID=1869181 RepID=UPI0025C364CC|nr:YdcF family protein [Chitinophaga sp.]MBV8252336.1 YdcF family protein [Chitinophaga sp.]